MKLVILFLLAACTPARAPETPESMLNWRLAHGLEVCQRACPLGALVASTTYPDCCVDPLGVTWSSCAWNSSGRYATRAQLMQPERIAGDCGGEGWPECEFGR